MQAIDEIKNICNRFENKEFHLKELKGRLSRVNTPEPDLHKIGALLYKADNDLEEIIIQD